MSTRGRSCVAHRIIFCYQFTARHTFFSIIIHERKQHIVTLAPYIPLLNAHFAHEPHWWPIHTPQRDYEVTLGMVLVQQTRWEAVEAAVLRILPTVNEQVYRAEQVICRRATPAERNGRLTDGNIVQPARCGLFGGGLCAVFAV